MGASSSHIDILSRLPGYFEEKGFKNPSDAFYGPFQYAMRTNLHYFDWIKSKPKHQTAFNTVMGISRMGRGEEWFEFYPVGKKLQVEASSQPLLVDVGGGLGHDLIAFKEKFPTLPGKLILEDLPIVIEDVKNLPEGIEAISHDFFTPQPVKGAKAYYLRTVLHDWPDKQARQILGHIRASMTKDSVLLINENTLPEAHVPLYPAELDLSMMAIFSSLDRTRTQFKDLLDSTGFALIQTWTPKVMVPGSGTLFEAVLKL